MTASRLAQFVAAVVGSWLAGIVGAFLVWNFIYSIGQRVVEDETYYRLHDMVTFWGGDRTPMVSASRGEVTFGYNPSETLNQEANVSALCRPA